MPKQAEDLQKHTLNLHTGDYARLQDLYPEHGAGKIIRALVRSFLKKIDKTPTRLPKVEMEL